MAIYRPLSLEIWCVALFNSGTWNMTCFWQIMRNFVLRSLCPFDFKCILNMYFCLIITVGFVNSVLGRKGFHIWYIKPYLPQIICFKHHLYPQVVWYFFRWSTGEVLYQNVKAAVDQIKQLSISVEQVYVCVILFISWFSYSKLACIFWLILSWYCNHANVFHV